MNITDTLGIAGCVLSAVHVAINFPGMVRAANNRHTSRGSLISGMFMYVLLLAYALLISNYLFAFVQILGLLQYSVVLIQLIINRR